MWFENEFYQGDKLRGFKAILPYDLKQKVIAVFKKSAMRFVTTCRLSDNEHDHLRATGNFQTKNSFTQQTDLNRIKNDGKEINAVNENSSDAFTEISSFESDVLKIAPKDNSKFRQIILF